MDWTNNIFRPKYLGKGIGIHSKKGRGWKCVYRVFSSFSNRLPAESNRYSQRTPIHRTVVQDTPFTIFLLLLLAAYGGMACDGEWGVCPQSSSIAVKFTVRVMLRLPAFREVGLVTQLFAAPGVPISPPVYSVPTLEDNSTIPLAMVNCPMRRIPFAFSVAGKYPHPHAEVWLIIGQAWAMLSAFA
jgi:hypothetical protein